ncbi:MAG: hypothetical protein K6U80_13555 [Firmicutes bacterium]|nr:hypothetical protein [Bacillota bacterium]
MRHKQDSIVKKRKDKTQVPQNAPAFKTPVFTGAATGIGIRNESSLHAALKEWYAGPGDQFEQKVDGVIVDLVKTDPATGALLLVEVQTRNFAAISPKLRKMSAHHPVRLVYPIPREKWIIRITADGELKSRRKSPKRGSPCEVFNELVRIPGLINEGNFSLEIILIKVEEIWREDGKGSWRRRGTSIIDRKLAGVFERLVFTRKEDFRIFLPECLPRPFSNKTLAQYLGSSLNIARKTTYCLKKMGVLKEVGKYGNELLFQDFQDEQD